MWFIPSLVGQLMFAFLISRAPESHSLYTEEAQDQSEAPNTFYHLSAAGFGAQVPSEAVPFDRWESRVLQLS